MNNNTILNSSLTPLLEEDEIVCTITSDMLSNTMLSNTHTIINPINTSSIYTTSNITTFPWGVQNSFNDKVKITSEDIFIDGQGLSERLEKIEKRLDILVVNPALEQKYEQLKKLGEEYRQLEKELLEKDKVLDILKR